MPAWDACVIVALPSVSQCPPWGFWFCVCPVDGVTEAISKGYILALGGSLWEQVVW